MYLGWPLFYEAGPFFYEEGGHIASSFYITINGSSSQGRGYFTGGGRIDANSTLFYSSRPTLDVPGCLRTLSLQTLSEQVTRYFHDVLDETDETLGEPQEMGTKGLATYGQRGSSPED